MLGGHYSSTPNSEHHETRFLTLHHGHFDSAIFCTLSEPQSLDTTKYMALSYVWGDKYDLRHVTVNGGPWPVTKNLEEGLRHVRCEHEDKLLWVDALCINQGNTDERNEQVTIMCDIFAGAENIAIWPGRVSATHRTWRYIKKTCFRLPLSEWDSTSIISLFVKMAYLPWFRRTWIIQELALSKSDPLLYLDTKVIPWSDFARFWDIARGRMTSTIDSGFAGYPGDQHKARFDMLISIRREVQEQDHAPLWSLLRCVRTSEASERKDKIFALRGMLSETERRTIVVDYSRSTAHVFADVLAAIFKAGHGPDVLAETWVERIAETRAYRSGFGMSNPPLDELPTWVPEFADFGADTNDVLTGLSFFPVPSVCTREDGRVYESLLKSWYGVSGSMSAEANGEVGNDLQSLFIDILPVGKVTDTFCFEAEQEHNLRILGLAVDFAGRTSVTNPKSRECRRVFERCRAGLWRTLICNKIPYIDGTRAAPDNFAEFFKDLVSQNPQQTSNEYTKQLARSLPRRTLFATDTGLLGMGPPAVSEGDEITIWIGSKVPFLVRPSTYERSTSHKLIRPCYVGGIMDGEIVNHLYKRGHMMKKSICVR